MFERVPLPTPFQIGPVNAYLAGRTVVDPGPDSEEALTALHEALDERGLALADLERVLVTHPHPDHFGLAKKLRAEGTRVVAHPDAVPILEDFPGRLEREQRYLREFFERCGMSESTAETVTDLPQAFVHYAPSVEVDRTVSAGDSITVEQVDYGDASDDGGAGGARDADTGDDELTLAVDDLVGHSTGELLFAFDDAGGESAIVGDHVLPHVTPNPFLQPPPEEGGERPRPLPAYNDSLESLRADGYDRLLPGHREVVDDPAGRIDELLAAHGDRTENVAAIVDGPTTPVAVMQELFDDLPVTEQFPGMCEAVGHLDVLEAQGRVTVREDGGLLVYEPSE